MGQYFVLVNLDKKEYIDPLQAGDFYKFIEVLLNGRTGKLLLFLLRKSNETGGGDLDHPDDYSLAGHWAGDRIVLVGDYDESKLFDKALESFVNITEDVIEQYNDFVEKYDPESVIKPLEL